MDHISLFFILQGFWILGHSEYCVVQTVFCCIPLKCWFFFFFGLNRAFTLLYSDCKHYVSSSNLKLSWVLFSLAETSHMHTLFWAQLKILAEFINRIWGSLHLPLSCPRFCLDFLGAVVAPNSGFLIFQTRKKKICEFAVLVLVSYKICLLSGLSPENGDSLGAIPTFLKNIKKNYCSVVLTIFTLQCKRSPELSIL